MIENRLKDRLIKLGRVRDKIDISNSAQKCSNQCKTLDRQTERQIDRYVDRQIDKQLDVDRQIDRYIYGQIDIQIDRQLYINAKLFICSIFDEFEFETETQDSLYKLIQNVPKKILKKKFKLKKIWVKILIFPFMYNARINSRFEPKNIQISTKKANISLKFGKKYFNKICPFLKILKGILGHPIDKKIGR